MANINFPSLIDDELLISYICRIAEENAMPADKFAMYFVHDLPARRNPDGKPAALSAGSSNYIPKLAAILGMQPLDLFRKTTLYPGTAPLILPGKQMRIINTAFRDIHQYPTLIHYPQSDIKNLKYCPVCATEDIRKYGYTWLRRAHQMPGVTACWAHGTRLENANINTRSDNSWITFPLVKASPATTTEIEYAVFARNFLKAGFDLNRVSSMQLVVRHSKSRSWIKALPPEQRSAAIENIDDFRLWTRKNYGPSTETSVLIHLFSVFHNVHDIPPYEDTFIRDNFFSKFSDYELVSRYHGNYMVIRKRSEDVEFVATAPGFLLGWRSPSDDILTETEKYDSIINNLNDLKYSAGLPPCEKTDTHLQQSIESNLSSLYRKTAEQQILRGKTVTTPKQPCEVDDPETHGLLSQL